MTIDLNDPVTITAKADIFAVLDTSPNEVPALLAALKEGRIQGEFYTGQCCCLVGTIANAKGIDAFDLPWRSIDGLDGVLKRDPDAPAERWFFSIQEGDKPSTSGRVAITVAWVEEWMAERVGGTNK